MNKNKNENISDLTWELSEILRSALKEIGRHYFGTREKLNEEKVLILSKNSDFISDVNKSRIFLKIPKLNPDEDFREFEYQGKTMEDSGFLYGKNNNYIIKFEREIRKILKKYELPKNFTDWVEHVVLYNKFSKTIPRYNVDIISQIVHDPKEAKRIGLTPTEKQFIKDFVRMKMRTVKIPREEIQRFYKTICAIIAKSKNSKRPSENIRTSIKTLYKPNTIEEHDYTEGKIIKHKFSFKDLAQKLNNKDLNELEIKKIANRLRQQKHRIKRKILPLNKQ